MGQMAQPWMFMMMMMIWWWFPGGKGGRCVGLTTLPPSCADCLEMWALQPRGTLWACPGP
jgi:hypothetical protein